MAQKSVLQFNSIQLPNQIEGSNLRMAVKDRAGLLWFVTGEGLYRYDGNELLHFGLKTTPALPSLTITALQTDGRGNLWIGFTNGVAKFDLRTWQITSLSAKDWRGGRPQDRNITSIACTPGGDTYLGTYSGKLYVTNGHNNSSSLSDDTSSNRLRLLMNLPFDKKSGKFNTIWDIQKPFPGQLWIQTAAGQLINLPIPDSSKELVYGKPAYYKFKGGLINVCYDSSGKCLYGSGSSIYLADIKQLSKHRKEASHHPIDSPGKGYVKKIPLPEEMTASLFSPFYISGKKVAIISGSANSPGNIYTFDFNNETWTLETPVAPVRLPGTGIRGISDQRSSTFICSGNTVTALRFQQSPIRPLLNGVVNNSIRSVYKDSNYLYVGSYRDGFMRYNLTNRKSKRLSPMIVYGILRWNKDSLLLATEGDGLHWYIPSVNHFKQINLKKDISWKDLAQFQSNFATVLCRVNDRLLLEGTYQGVFLVDPVKKISYAVFTDSLSAIMQSVKINAIMPLQKHNRNSYLIATNAGVFEANVNTGRVKYFLANDSIARKIRSAAAYSLFSRKGQIWMGTNGYGVQIADTSGKIIQSQWLNTQLSGQVIYQITSSGNSLLLGTNNGLNVLSIKDSTLTQYSVFNGLPANEFNQSAVFSTEKQAYLGTINGLVEWNDIKTEPGSVSFHTTISKQTIIDKHNQRKEIYRFPYLPKDSQQIVVAPETKYFSITFGRPEENHRLNYYFRLSGNNPWIKVGESKEISFIKTPPGEYKLQFAARRLNGDWMEDTYAIPLTILPAFYQTLLFKIVLALILVGLLALLYRYNEIRRNKEHNLRIKIAGDLHDEVGSSLTRIWHQVQQMLPNSTHSAENKNTRFIHSISETSREALSAMSDMVWSVDARFDTLKDLVMRIKDYVYKLQDELDVPLEFKLEGDFENRKISQIVRQNLFLLFKEALNNAIKHGDGGFISIHMSFGQHHLDLQVVNSYARNGKKTSAGIQGGKGMENMKRRVLKMHGNLQVDREEDKFQVRVLVKTSKI